MDARELRAGDNEVPSPYEACAKLKRPVTSPPDPRVDLSGTSDTDTQSSLRRDEYG